MKPSTALTQVKLSSSSCGHWFRVCLSARQQPGLSASTGSAAGSSGPGTGGHCELAGKGMIEAREREADGEIERWREEGEGRRGRDLVF